MDLEFIEIEDMNIIGKFAFDPSVVAGNNFPDGEVMTGYILATEDNRWVCVKELLVERTNGKDFPLKWGVVIPVEDVIEVTFDIPNPFK